MHVESFAKGGIVTSKLNWPMNNIELIEKVNELDRRKADAEKMEKELKKTQAARERLSDQAREAGAKSDAAAKFAAEAKNLSEIERGHQKEMSALSREIGNLDKKIGYAVELEIKKQDLPVMDRIRIWNGPIAILNVAWASASYWAGKQRIEANDAAIRDVGAKARFDVLDEEELKRLGNATMLTGAVLDAFEKLVLNTEFFENLRYTQAIKNNPVFKFLVNRGAGPALVIFGIWDAIHGWEAWGDEQYGQATALYASSVLNIWGGAILLFGNPAAPALLVIFSLAVVANVAANALAPDPIKKFLEHCYYGWEYRWSLKQEAKEFVKAMGS